MSNFNVNFSKESTYNPQSAFTQVRFGFGAPLLEAELNELQQIQTHFRKKILNNLYGGKNGLKNGEFFYDKLSHELQYQNLTLLINGDFYDLGNGTLTVTPNQTIVMNHSAEVIDGTSHVYKYGKVEQDEKLENTIIDERVMEETSRRVQAQFQFQMIDGDGYTPEEGETVFGYVDMSGEFRVRMEEITVESAVTIEPQALDSLLANFPIGASNFSLDNTPTFNEIGDLVAVGQAEQLGYRFPNVAVYSDLNVVTEKYANGYATQYAYLGSGHIYFREVEGSGFGEWVQIIDGTTFVAYQERVNKQILDLTMEVAILSSATSSGVDSNIVIETFKNIDDIKLTKGKFDSENNRVHLTYTI